MFLSAARTPKLQLTAEQPLTGECWIPPKKDTPHLRAKNNEVGCHFLRQCMKVKSENEVTESCPTLSDPMDCSLPGSSVHGIFQARILEWGAIAWPCPTEQDPVSPTVSLSQQEAYISLLSLSIRGQTEWKLQSQKTNQTNHIDHGLV